MGVFSGPEINTDGLVLYFDRSNINKSWKGKPTTNLAPYTDYSNRNFNTPYVASSWDTDYATIYYYQTGGYNNLPYKKMVKTAGGSGGSLFNDHSYFTLEEGKTYIISCYMKANQPTTVGGHTLALNRDSDNAYRVPDNFSVTTNWERKQWTYTCGVGEGGTTYHFRQIVYNDAGLPLEVYWSGLQIEEGILPSAYVNGTRSNTQAVIDLSGRSTITANNLTYSTDNTFSFNGTSSYLDCGNLPTYQLSSAVTLEAWVKPNSSTGLGNIISKNMNGGYRFRIENGNLLAYSNGNFIVASGGICTNNSWWHCVATFGPTGLRGYVNGNLVASNATAYTPSDVVSNPLLVGCYWPSAETFDGIIDIAKVYNRVLTADEVSQNFNALRGRYGI